MFQLFARSAYRDLADHAGEVSVVVDDNASVRRAKRLLRTFRTAMIHGYQADEERGETVLMDVDHERFELHFARIGNHHGPGEGSLDEIGFNPQVLVLDRAVPVLQGGQAILPNVNAALCRVTFHDGQGETLFHEVADILHIYGLRLFRLYDVHSAKSGQWQFADALFVRPAQ